MIPFKKKNLMVMFNFKFLTALDFGPKGGYSFFFFKKKLKIIFFIAEKIKAILYLKVM